MEVDVINDAFSYVLNNKRSIDMVNEIDIKDEKFWNSDLFDGGSSLIWYSDNYTKSCSRVTQKCQQIDDKLRAPVTADILACLRFEGKETDGTGGQHSNQRALKFSTGLSISVENLFPRVNESDLLSENDGGLFLDNSEFSDVEHGEFYDHGDQQNHLIEDKLPFDDEDQNGCYIAYSNPFDPRLTFHGLTDIFTTSKDGHLNRKSSNQSVNACGQHNFLMALEDPITDTNEYLHDYRKLTNQWPSDIPHVTRRASPRGKRCLEQVERIARRNIDDLDDSEQLWLKISNTRNLWTDDPMPLAPSPCKPARRNSPVQNIELSTRYGMIDARDLERTESHIEHDHEGQHDNALGNTADSQNGGNTLSDSIFTPDVPRGSVEPMRDISNDASPFVAPHINNVEMVEDPDYGVRMKHLDDDNVHRLLVPVLNADVHGTSVDRMETDVDKARICDMNGTQLLKPGIDSGHYEVGVLNSGRCVSTAEPQFVDTNSGPLYREAHTHSISSNTRQSASPQMNEQEPLVRYPYSSSMFWKDYGDIDPLIQGDGVQRQPPTPKSQQDAQPKPQQDAPSSLLTPIVHHKEYQPPAAPYGSPVLLPHLNHQPVHPPSLLQVVIRPPHQNRFPLAHPRAIPRGNRATPNSHSQPQLHQQPHPPFKHYYPRPPPVPANFQIPPPVLQQYPALKDGKNKRYHHIRPPLPLRHHSDSLPGNNADVKHVLTNQDTRANPTSMHMHNQPFLQPLNNSDIKARENQNQVQSNSREKHLNCPPNMFEAEPRPSGHDQTQKTITLEPAFVLPCLNVSAPSFQSFQSEARIPFLPPSTSANFTKPSNVRGETQSAGHNDPNFRLDDEIWYINGIPHRHARPMHSLQSTTPFYPRGQHSGNESNTGGINRRIAEQVAKINHTYIDPPNVSGHSQQPHDGMMPLTNPNAVQSHCERGDIVNLYPIYSNSGMNDSNNVYPLPRNQRMSGNHRFNDVNNNNIDLNEDILKRALQSDLGDLNDLMASKEFNIREYLKEVGQEMRRLRNQVEDIVTHGDPGRIAISEYTESRIESSDETKHKSYELDTGPWSQGYNIDILNEISRRVSNLKALESHGETEFGGMSRSVNHLSHSTDYVSPILSLDSDNTPYMPGNIISPYSLESDNALYSVEYASSSHSFQSGNAIRGAEYASSSYSLESDKVPYSVDYASSSHSFESDSPTYSVEYASSSYSLESDNSPRNEDYVHAMYDASSDIGTSSDYPCERQHRSNDFELDQSTSGIRHIRVLGRNRHQKEKERTVRKRKEINRSVLVQLV